MAKKDDRLGQYIAAKLEQAEKRAAYWRKISVKYVLGEKVNIRVDDRPDLEYVTHEKNDQNTAV
jgi:hypothetical protein